MINYEEKQKIKNDTLSLEQGLADFRQYVPLQAIEIGKHQWTYYAKGKPEHEALLLLSGGGGDAGAMFQYIEAFSQHFRVIAPNLPPAINTLDDAVNGLRAMLSELRIERVIVAGISFGAMLAQLYIQRFQDSVIDMVITHSLIPSKHLAEASRMQKTLMGFYPAPLLMWMSKQAYIRHIDASTTPAADATKLFWQSYFNEIYGKHIRKRHLMSRARLMAEYHSENEFNSRDLLNWHGELLIIESEKDTVISEGDRGSLKMMYSRAYIQTLYGYDHLAVILAADEIISSIINFLLKEG